MQTIIKLIFTTFLLVVLTTLTFNVTAQTKTTKATKTSTANKESTKDVKKYHSVIAKNGDGVFSLLRRYGLNKYSSDVQRFYSLNNINKDGHLQTGKVYILPILLYAYNGTSIRSTIDNDDWDKAIRIQEYNEFLVKNKLRKRSYRESKILWVPQHEILKKEKKIKTEKQIKKTLPIAVNTPDKVTKEKKATQTKKLTSATKKTKGKDVYEPLFGKKHSSFKRIDNSLKNKVFYVVSGHGGPDPGAQCTKCINTLCEDEYAYDVALRLVRDLEQHGALVHMIIQDKNDGIRDEMYLACDYDETCMGKKIPRKQVARLKQRVTAINTLYRKYKKQGFKDQRAIMIHVDSNNEKKKQDTYFYYYKKSKSGKALAHMIQKTFKQKYEKYQKGRGYKGSVRERGLYLLRNTNPTAVYVELANIRNQNDQKRLLLESNRQALANWLFEGLIK